MTLRALIVTAVAASAVLAPSAAQAADEVEFSDDGAAWSSSLPDPVFDPAFRWVPGDSQTASFFVRNNGPSAALMTIEARSADTDELLADDDIDLQARVAGGSWVALDNGVITGPLTQGSIARGDVVEVQVNATFDPDATNQSQTRRLPLTFTVTLAEALEGDGTGGGLLPGTGAKVGFWTLTLALGASVIGGAIVVRRWTFVSESTHV
ncbi:hypothetical protein [Aeromicrobium sp. Sec7.5]|uniref:hypothetical protein n=1 Tax=Aeromicrobium sp. Sec7.5 TaxID=3121276 RepID=UPI002FE4BFF0